MNKKFWVSVLAAASVFACCAVTTSGQTEQVNTLVSHTIDGVEVPMEKGAQPRFKYFNSISVRMVQKSGLATCTGTASVEPEYDNTLVVSVERRKDGNDWKETTAWSKEGLDESSIILERKYYLTKGYEYQAISTITVNTGEHTEVASITSNTVYY